MKFIEEMSKNDKIVEIFRILYQSIVRSGSREDHMLPVYFFLSLCMISLASAL